MIALFTTLTSRFNNFVNINDEKLILQHNINM